MTWDGGVVGESNIDVSRPHLDADGKPCIELKFNFPHGSTHSTDENSALVRPFLKLLRDGKPIGKITYSFYQEGSEYYTLGSFVFTEKRLIFFPGLKIRKVTRSPDGKNPLNNGLLQNLDHISLENNWRTWHYTLLQKETRGDRYEKMNTRKLDESSFLWFVMGVKSTDKLEFMPRSQEIRISGFTMNDLTRRFKDFMYSRSGSIFPISKIKGEVEEPYYINFEFFVNLKQTRDYIPPDEVFHLSNLTEETLVNELPINSRSVRVLIGSFSGAIWIRASKLRGKLTEDMIIRSGHEYTLTSSIKT